MTLKETSEFIIKYSEEIIYGLLFITTILGLIFKSAIIDLFSNKIFLFIKKMFNRNKHTVATSYSYMNSIYNELNTLKGLTTADRAFIWEFHNGNQFLSNNPIWKISQTYELCSDGIAGSKSNIVGLPITLFWEVFHLFFDYAETKGITKINDSLLFDINDLNYSVFKSAMQIDGTLFIYIKPIFNVKMEIVALLGLSYLSENMNNNYDEIKESADMIANYWNIKKSKMQ